LSTAIKASAALTPVIQPVAIGDKVYIDGWARANLPANAARETGSSIVIAVQVDQPLSPLPPKRFMHMRAIAARLIDIILATGDERQLQFADVVICPNVSGISLISNRSTDLKKAILAGELAAEKALPEIRRRLKHRATMAASSNTMFH